jgi:hypothetical protein
MDSHQWNIGQILGAAIGGLVGLLFNFLVAVVVMGIFGRILGFATYIILGGSMGWLMGKQSGNEVSSAIVGAILGFGALYLTLAMDAGEMNSVALIILVVIWLIIGAKTGGEIGGSFGKKWGWTSKSILATIQQLKWVLLAISLLIVVAIVGVLGLQPCLWLDRVLNWTGCLHTIDIGQRVDYLVVAPNGETVASVGWNHEEIKLWRVTDGVLLHTLNSKTSINKAFNMAFTSDGQFWLHLRMMN